MEKYKCPNCIDEELARIVGNLLACRSCDLTWVEKPKELQPIYNRDTGDETDAREL